ncbi:MAG: DUF4249 domain-containing protein [Cyclobacteriaceae bacterium]
MRKLLIVMLLSACIEPYEFEAADYDEVLVVDGLLTDEDKFHYVTLSKTFPLDGSASKFVTNANVSVESEGGERYDYFHTGNGVYQPSASFAGRIGERYRVLIDIEDKNYVSIFNELIASPEIDSIYAKYESVFGDGVDENSYGLQFYVDAHDPTGKAQYFRYQYEETYVLRAPYPADYVWLGGNEYAPRPFDEQVSTCYLTDTSTQVLYTTSNGNVEQRVAEFPLRFIAETGKEMRQKYTMNLFQYAIDQNAFSYFKNLKSNNESKGSLFDQQPGAVPGNIVGPNNELVLGYFTVAGVSTKRDWFLPSDFTPEGFRLQSNDRNCTDEMVQIIDFDTLGYFMSSGEAIYDIFNVVPTFPPPPPDVTPGIYVSIKTCTRCTHLATNMKPEFWE